jgi:CRP-like cAMP-binding protein
MLLHADSDLAERLAPEERRDATAMLRASVLALEAGAWRPAALSDRAFGYLVLEGLLVRELGVGGASASELLGPGDIVRPLDSPLLVSSLTSLSSRWQILQRARVAVLDERVSEVIACWPALSVALVDRVLSRAHALAHLLAVSHLPRVQDRLLGTLWYLADRWGRVTPGGVIIPVRLTHQLLGELVGAQRSTVTLAVHLLEQEELLSRAARGIYLLRGDPPALPAHFQADTPQTR